MKNYDALATYGMIVAAIMVITGELLINDSLLVIVGSLLGVSSSLYLLIRSIGWFNEK